MGIQKEGVGLAQCSDATPLSTIEVEETKASMALGLDRLLLLESFIQSFGFSSRNMCSSFGRHF